jgi:aspartyl-tRNA synthetase
MVSQGQRTHTCGALRAGDVGATVALSGWVNSCRAMGENLVFVDLRDKYGIIQVAFDDSVSGELRQRAHALKHESVIHATGKVRRRPPGQCLLIIGAPPSWQAARAGLGLAQAPAKTG